MGKITIQEIAKILVEKNHIESQAASQFVNEMFAIILDRLSQGEAVKVKGLGTFKIIDVEARESVSVRTGERVVIDGHSKVTFTPDATMKELVNKPFSHFETVMLNEGVEFEDMKEPEPPAPEQQEPVAEEPVAEEPVAEEPVAEEPVVEESVAEEPVAEEPVAEEPVAEQPKPAEEPAVVQPPIMPAFHKQTHEEPKEEEMENKKKKSIWPSILKCLLVLALMAASAYIGYYYGSNKPLPDVAPDTIVVRDTVDLQAVKKDAESKINSAKQEAEEKAKQEAEEKAKQEAAAKAKQEAEEKAKQQAAKAAKAKAKAEEKKAAQTAAIADKYAAKDARVRLGAYRIVGLDHEVKVQAGQTFYSICKANLGPDMECYVEVYNDLPSRPTLKEGQIIKIPKLELKKKRKQ